MTDVRPVFIADTCICGLSVVRSLWQAGAASDAIFLADYAVNPLGVKSDDEIAEVIDRWLTLARKESDTLLLACNTLSLRYRELYPDGPPGSAPSHVVSMVDCFEAMVSADPDRFANKRVLVVGTRYTASQDLYPAILERAAPGVRATTIAATELERAVARFEDWDDSSAAVLTESLRHAIEDADVAVLACTCFPMAAARLARLFPGVDFVDPGAWCHELLPAGSPARAPRLRLGLTGDVVSAGHAVEFARNYLDTGAIECCTWP